jgi:hypothetical protein
MVGRSAIPPEVLAELGWLTIIYSGLEEHLIDMIGALVNPGDQDPAQDIAARMGFRDKTETLGRLFSRRCEEAHLAEIKQPMTSALRACTAAGSARNDLVHGIADYANGCATVTRPGKKPVPITLQSVQRVNGLLFEALVATLNAFGLLWNTTKGRFQQSEMAPDSAAIDETRDN